MKTVKHSLSIAIGINGGNVVYRTYGVDSFVHSVVLEALPCNGKVVHQYRAYTGPVSYIPFGNSWQEFLPFVKDMRIK